VPALDIFNDNAFGVTSLTQAINDEPHQPMQIGSTGLFREDPISTTALFIERRGTTITLVPTAARGSSGTGTPNDKARLIPITTVHLPQHDAVLADEVQNVRAFGSETELALVSSIVNRKLGKLRRNIDVTMEWQRIGAIKGQVLDADGTTVLLDMFETFGVTQQVKSLGFSTATNLMSLKIIEAKRLMEAALGGLMYTGIHIYASPGWFDGFVGHASVQKAYDRYLEGQFLRSDNRKGFAFADVVIEEYRGRVSGKSFITDGDAFMLPLGVADMFSTSFAPADYMETVNTMGLPYYAKQEMMKYGKGIEIEAQSNPISICARPDAVLRLTA
jgi:hypothetical protein